MSLKDRLAQQREPLDDRGQSIRDHYQKWRPKEYKRLVQSGEAPAFFLRQQQGYYDLEERLKRASLPGGGDREILRARFYPRSEEEERMENRLRHSGPF